MRHVLTRQQLNDMIWERAVSNVAPGLGISDVALRKLRRDNQGENSATMKMRKASVCLLGRGA